MPSDVRLVVFDLGGVLVRICDGWQHACRTARVSFRVKELNTAENGELHRIVAEHETGRIDLEEFCRQLAPVLDMTPQHVAAMSNVYLRNPYPGVAELIDAIRSAGCQTACFSNTNANHWRILNNRAHASYLPLDRMNYQFASHLIGHRKPDAGAYEHVERVTKLAGAQIAFFDDLKENIVAAQSRGWQATLIIHDNEPIKQIRRHLARLGVLK